MANSMTIVDNTKSICYTKIKAADFESVVLLAVSVNKVHGFVKPYKENYMRFLHTSDLHLGLRLCETRMNDDIAYLLREIVDIACSEDCDAVVIAGDIYDRSNPTPDSIAIFDEFVTSLSRRGITVLAVAGNHDSPERVAYLSKLLEQSGVHFSPLYDGILHTVIFNDEYGEVHFHLLPFLRPSVLRLTCPDFDDCSATEAVRYALRDITASDKIRHVIIAHQFVADSASSDESVGGTELVKADIFKMFDYTALGHLHRSHSVGAENVHYSGSPMKCSFSEVDDEKSVTIVDMCEKGSISLKKVPLHPMHDLREMRGSYAEMTSLEARMVGDMSDYLRIILTDDEDIPDVMAKLRCIYPNLMRLSYDNRRTREARMIADDILNNDDNSETVTALTPESVFAELFELQNNTPPNEKIMDIVKNLFLETEKEEEQ